jgi:hypothetical protein
MATATQTPAVAGTRRADCLKCDHGLHVFGRGRHRIYFEMGDARLNDPVMDSVCPECGYALPGKTGASAS